MLYIQASVKLGPECVPIREASSFRSTCFNGVEEEEEEEEEEHGKFEKIMFTCILDLI